MTNQGYDIEYNKSATAFEFVSNGPRGEIYKEVRFSQTEFKNVFNLALVDKNSETGEISDTSISNNSDTEKVLATVALAVLIFIENHKNASVIAYGNTPARTRLYRMGITKHFKEISDVVKIYGLLNKTWEAFRKNINYKAFLVRKK